MVAYGLREPHKYPVYFKTEKARDAAFRKIKKGAWVLEETIGAWVFKETMMPSLSLRRKWLAKNRKGR